MSNSGKEDYDRIRAAFEEWASLDLCWNAEDKVKNGAAYRDVGTNCAWAGWYGASAQSTIQLEDRYIALLHRIAAARWNNDDELDDKLCSEADVIWKQHGNIAEKLWQDGCRWTHKCVEQWPAELPTGEEK